MTPPASSSGKRALRLTIAISASAAAAAFLLLYDRLQADRAAQQEVSISIGQPAHALFSDNGSDPSLAVDGDETGAGWRAPMPFGTTWWQTELAFPTRIERIVVHTPASSKPYRYAIQGSLDGNVWFPVAAKSGASTTSTGESGDEFDVKALARYVRIVFVRQEAGQAAELLEVRIEGDPADDIPPPVSLADGSGTDLGAYGAGSNVKLTGALLQPAMPSADLIRATLKIYGISRPDFLLEVPLPEGTPSWRDFAAWTIPEDASPGAYGVHLQTEWSDGTFAETDAGFFRIVRPDDLTVYEIREDSYNGLPVWKLDGGMSAEYAVQKSAEALGPAVSHSWFTSRGSFGPNPVYATPSFLSDSVQQTVDFYNAKFGAARKFETVVISTGVASAPYLSRALEAPVLPLQFLAGLDSVRELRGMLNRAAQQGLDAYGALGYDASMTPAVAWLKLLDLPPAYEQFLIDHQVENIVLMGSYGTIGETASRKVIAGPDSLTGGPSKESGEIYVMYPAGGTASDTVELNNRILDLALYSLDESLLPVTDWESGVTESQVNRFTESLRAKTSVRDVVFVSGRDTLHLYEFASYVAMAYYKKNEELLKEEGGSAIRGIAMNPYLASHPFYEARMGEIPLLFWQFSSLRDTVDVRLNQELRRAVARTFPDVDFDALSVRISTTNNFGQTVTEDRLRSRLTSAGFTRIEAPGSLSDEVWDLGDGANALSETLAERLYSLYNPSQLADWDNRMLPLTIAELLEIPSDYPAVSMTHP